MSKFTDYIFTPKDVVDAVRYVARQIRRRDVLGLLFLIGGTIILRAALHPELETIFFLLFIVILIFWRLDARVALAFGLGCLGMILFLNAFQIDSLLIEEASERIAVWAYYFLAIGVIKLIIDMAISKRRESPDTYIPHFEVEPYYMEKIFPIPPVKKYMDIHRKDE